MTPSVQLGDVAAILSREPPRWQDVRISAGVLLELCAAEDLAMLVHHQLTQRGVGNDWPESVCEALAAHARTAAAEELLRGAETRAVVEALAVAGISALLIKGTALAYTVYPAPAARPRHDTDFIIPSAHVSAAQKVMASLGYVQTVQCSDLFSQFEVQKRDRFGVVHAFDVHWKISTQPVFADVLTFEEMWTDAVPVPALGPSAAAPSAIHSLLLSCIHPAMHHQNTERILWLYDTHLLASRLTHADFLGFSAHARQKRVAAVCAHHLRLAQATFGTRVPDAVMSDLLAAADEPSAAYLASERRWHHELVSSVRGLPRFGDRIALVTRVLLPSSDYMLGVYGLRGKPLAAWLLPALYVHRGAHGAWRILAGKK